MKIEHGNKNKIELSRIIVGEVFEYDGTFYLKTCKSDDGWRTCVSLEDGSLIEFQEKRYVHKCETKILIE